MLYWRCHFGKELQVNCLSTKQKCTYIYWTLDMEGEVHSTWDLWTRSHQECKGNVFFWSRAGRAMNFRSGSKNLEFLPIDLPLKARRGAGGKSCLRAAIYRDQEPWPWNSKGPSKLSKGHTMDNRKSICNGWALEVILKWKWTMLRDHNICSSSGIHHGNIIFLRANGISIDYNGL